MWITVYIAAPRQINQNLTNLFFAVEEEPLYFENFDLENIVMPVNADRLFELLCEANYNPKETRFLVEGFRLGFDMGYRGPTKQIQRRAPNLKLRIGSPTILWNKIMREVEKKHFAGPFKKVPFDSYIQSPVGLVPKDGGKETRLIFHLPYPRSGSSINSETPQNVCSVHYPDFTEAIQLCLREGVLCHLSKLDMKSAFRNLCMSKWSWAWLIIMAKSPIDGQIYFFVDKCLPFGASISCAHFQHCELWLIW